MLELLFLNSFSFNGIAMPSYRNISDSVVISLVNEYVIRSSKVYRQRALLIQVRVARKGEVTTDYCFVPLCQQVKANS